MRGRGGRDWHFTTGAALATALAAAALSAALATAVAATLDATARAARLPWWLLPPRRQL